MKGFKISGTPPLMDRLDAVIHCAEDGELNGVYGKPVSSLRIFPLPGLQRRFFRAILGVS